MNGGDIISINILNKEGRIASNRYLIPGVFILAILFYVGILVYYGRTFGIIKEMDNGGGAIMGLILLFLIIGVNAIYNMVKSRVHNVKGVLSNGEST